MKDMTKLEIQKQLENNKKFIKSKFHVKKIGLFGSFATGEYTTNSDIDILVDFQKGHKDFFNYIRLQHYLQELFGKQVDLVMSSAVKPQLRDNIFAQVQYV